MSNSSSAGKRKWHTSVRSVQLPNWMDLDRDSLPHGGRHAVALGQRRCIRQPGGLPGKVGGDAVANDEERRHARLTVRLVLVQRDRCLVYLTACRLGCQLTNESVRYIRSLVNCARNTFD